MRAWGTALTFAVTLFMGTLFMAGPVLAQNPPPPPPCTPGIPCLEYEVDSGANKAKADFNDLRKTCDGDVMNQIHARAFLEAQRENMMNQQAIRKPDSILSYSCFDQFVGTMAKKAPPLFSESTKWSGMTVSTSVTGKPPNFYPPTRTLNVNMGDGHIEDLIGGVALAPVSNFTRDNFNHDYLGGTTAIASPIGSSVQRIDKMLCTRMQAVWTAAKCQDFNFDITPFSSFEELASADPRTLVSSCNNQKISAAYIAVAANKAPPYPEFKSGQPTDDDPIFDPASGEPKQQQSVKIDGIRHLYKDDPATTYSEENLEDYFDPKLANFDRVGDGCAPPVKTGVKLVVRAGTTDEYANTTATVSEYDDAICPNPHCYYYKVDGRTLGTCVTK